MAANCSTGFRRRIIGPESFESIFNGAAIDVYTGPQPESANHAPTGTYLGRITHTGAAWGEDNTTHGLRFIRSGIYATSRPDQSWVLKGSATGVAGWCRLRLHDDDGSETDLFPRIDGAIGTHDDVGDIQMRLPSVTLAVGTSTPITTWWWLLPPFE